MMLFLLELNSVVETSMNEPGDTPKLTFVDLIFVTRSMSQSILLWLLLKLD